jgi:photosystem II stability/assembly factor-like uncharacterized protein
MVSNNMKRIIYTTAALFLIIGLGLFKTNFSSSVSEKPVVETEKETPLNPGWIAQFREMKTNDSGVVPVEMVRSIREQQRRNRRNAGNLKNVQEAGPDNVGGRTRALLIDRANPNRLFAGAVSGGLWESTDKGQSWHPVDDFGSNLSVTSITQNPFDPDIFYYSTGEPTGNSAGIPGDGIYKSTDGGKTFFKLPASNIGDFNYTWKIVHSITDSNTIYVGTEDDGLFKSTDGGNTFKPLFGIGSKDINDIEVFPDSSVMIAMNNGGIYYSPSGDSATFALLTNGLPPNQFKRIEMDYCDSFPNVVYAVFINNGSNDVEGVYKTVDGGQNWVVLDDPTNGGISFGWPWYCLFLEVKPDNPDYVILGSVTVGASLNGGAKWVSIKGSHSDYHICQFDPSNTDQLYIGNDGGVYRYDVKTIFNKTEDLNNGYNVTQFYAGTFFPDEVSIYGGTQDNGTQSSKSSDPDFDHIFGGDGAFTQVNQQDGRVAYVSYQNGKIHRSDDANLAFPNFYNVIGQMDGSGNGSIDDGAWFINPYEMNRNDGEQLYFSTRKRVWRTITGAAIWEPITGDLNNLTGGTPYAVGISNSDTPTVYVGGSKGLFFRIDSASTTTAGKEKNLMASVPDSVNNHFIVSITVSPQFDSVVYVAFSNYSNEPRLYKVYDAKSDTPVWVSIHGDMPLSNPVNWVEVSPLTDSVIIAATDFGLYTTVDAGQHWLLESDIPNVSIHNIRLRHTDGKLFVFSHGRGAWTANIPGNFATGKKDLKEENTALTLFPNPASNTIYLNLDSEKDLNASFRILNLNGQVVQQGEVRQVLNIESLQKGIYFLQVERTDQSKQISRFVKL